MQLWVVEHGTLWVLETGNGLPPQHHAQVETTFKEIAPAGLKALASAMQLKTEDRIRERLQSGRRCFALTVGDAVVSYCWVTHGVEHVGELERKFHLLEEDTYIWDCATVPAWRGQGCYSALLSHIIHRLAKEGVSRIWIGASRENRPSVRGFANAGFQPILDLVYRRIYRLTLMWIDLEPNVAPDMEQAALRILINKHERRLGPLVVGYLR